MGDVRLKGAFAGCKWCHGSGCLCCAGEREKALQEFQQPILSVTHEELRDPTLGPLIKDAIGVDALRKAFGPGGGGSDEIRYHCAVVSLVQALRKCDSRTAEGDSNEPDAE